MKAVLVLLNKPYQGKDYLVVKNVVEWTKISEKIELEDDISTDCLFPARFASETGNWGAMALSGHASDLKMNSILELEIGCVVAGDNFGIGSSRVQAVRALMDAGVELVIAKSFYPIYRKNAVNAGLKISNNLDLVEKYISGEKIIFSDLKLKPLEQTIMVAGGWLNYLRKQAEEKISVKEFNEKNLGVAERRGMTMIEKYLSRAAKMKAVAPGQVVMLDLSEALLGAYDIYGGIIKGIVGEEEFRVEGTLATSCHFAPGKKKVDGLKKMWQDFALAHDMDYFGYGQGVCHSIIEQKAREGQLVVFTDSHTPHIGYKGLGLSVGADELAAALKYRRSLFEVPATTRITFRGKLRKGVMLRDVAMHILGLEVPTNTCLEYHGTENLGCAREELAVLTNIAVEARSVTAVVAPTGEEIGRGKLNQNSAAAFSSSDLTKHNYSDPQLAAAPNERLQPHSTGDKCGSKNNCLERDNRKKQQTIPLPDTDATYLAEIEVDLGEVEAMIALPPRPQKVRKLREFVEGNEEVRINKIWIGSCVGGSRADLDKALAWLQDKKIARGVKLYVQPNSLMSYIAVLKKYGGWIEKNARQVKLLEAACGACMGQGEGAVKEGETMLSTATRNLTGRNAVGSKIYLGSSMTCARAVVVGRIV